MYQINRKTLIQIFFFLIFAIISFTYACNPKACNPSCPEGKSKSKIGLFNFKIQIDFCFDCFTKEHKINTNYTANVTGCSEFISSFNLTEYQNFETCCEQIDTCYTSCTKTKSSCDLSAKKCLDKICAAKTSKTAFTKKGKSYII